MYMGLTLTYASVFQMLRGSVVIFTGLLSVWFLKRKLHGYHWLGMSLVLLGLLLVGLSSVLDGGTSSNAPNPLLGDLFVIVAQLVVAIQMVLEEKYIGKYDVPALQAVGWEGVFGFCLMSCLLIIFQFIPGSANGNKLENTPDAIYQLGGSSIILLATLGNLVSIAFFNFFGISVTKEMSATTRMVLDSVRTFIIWTFSLIVGWQVFGWLQVAGFVLLLTGTCVYQKILVLPFMRPPAEGEAASTQQKLLDPTSTESGQDTTA
jgi:drug/metabolite transporter (DMT)-like permease